MSNMKSTLVRTAAAVAATVLVSVGGMAPALADHDHGNGSSQDHRAATGTEGGNAKSAGRQGPKQDKGEKDKGEKDKGEKDKGEKAKGGNGQGDERGNGHTPVTVCHVLGNGSYNVLTFDDNALEAHVNHGDIYPVPADGCPAETVETAEEPVVGTTPQDDETPAEETPAEETPADDATTEDDARVAGVEEFATTTSTQPRDAQILGVEAVAGANRTAPVTGPLAGILPQTGAGQLGLAAAAGLLLLGAGVTLVARRRAHGV